MSRSMAMMAPVRALASIVDGGHELFDDLVVRLGARQVPEKARAAEVRQRPADLRLEDDNGGEDDVAGDVADEPVDRVEVPPFGQVEHAGNQPHADAHLDRTGAAHELEQLIDRDGGDEDVDDIRPSHLGPLEHQIQ